MLLSRGASLMRSINIVRKTRSVQKEVVRQSHDPCYYRTAAPVGEQKGAERWAEIVGGFAWWWILWHVWTEPGHILGEFEYPDARKWTDEELGIVD